MKLEKYLVLNKYFLSLFGAESISDLRDKLKDTKGDFDQLANGAVEDNRHNKNIPVSRKV